MPNSNGDPRSFTRRIAAANTSIEDGFRAITDGLRNALYPDLEDHVPPHGSSSGSLSTPRTLRPPSGWIPDMPLPEPMLREEQLASTANPKLPVSTSYCGLKPYSNFLSEIITYASPTPQITYPKIRETLQRLCFEKAIDNINAFVSFPDDAIFPRESGSFLFADDILQSHAAMCAFFTPDSKYIWFHFPREPPMRPPITDFIAHLAARGDLKPRQCWRPGQKQHKTFWEMARKACYYAEPDKRDRAHQRGVDTHIIPYSHLAKGARNFRNGPKTDAGQNVGTTGSKNLYRGVRALRYGWERPCSPIVPGGDERINEAITTEYADGNKYGDVKIFPGVWIPPLGRK